jgi:CheY-like chemotaxis protein
MPALAEIAAEAADEVLPGLPPLRVAAAEDNATNRLILDSLLLRLGVEAVILDSGEAVLRHWQEAEVDVLLLDIAMPGCDGVATLTALRALAARTGRALPRVLAVTANAMTHQVEGYLASGFDGVVPKPLREDDLARALLAAAARDDAAQGAAPALAAGAARP